MDATSEFMERIAALRSAVAGEVTSAEGIAATPGCAPPGLRRVHAPPRVDAPEAPRRVNAELMVGGELRPRAAGGRGRPAGHDARWNPGGYSLAAVAGTGQLTPVPPRPQ